MVDGYLPKSVLDSPSSAAELLVLATSSDSNGRLITKATKHGKTVPDLDVCSSVSRGGGGVSTDKFGPRHLPQCGISVVGS